MSNLGNANKKAGQSLEKGKLGLLPHLCNNASRRFSFHKMEQRASGNLGAAINVIDGWREDEREVLQLYRHRFLKGSRQ